MPREPAWRVFASEFNSAKHYIKATEPKMPSYVITPLGAKISRLFIVGVLTEVRVVSDDAVKARVVDHTGAFYLFAGKFRPNVRQVLESVNVPQFVAVVGKSNVYQPNDDTMYLSVVPERLKVVNEILRDYWVFDTARKLKIRIEAMQEALKMDEPTVRKLVDLGFSEKISDGVITAIKYYGRIDVERYSEMLKDALKHLLPEYQEMGYEMPSLEEEEEEEEIDVELEQKVLEAISELDDGDGASYEELLQKLGMSSGDIDPILDTLKDRGEIYEPKIGKLKRLSA